MNRKEFMDQKCSDMTSFELTKALRIKLESEHKEPIKEPVKTPVEVWESVPVSDIEVKVR